MRSADAQGIFNPVTLQLVRELTAEFQGMPGINPSNVTSLATEPSFRTRPGTLIHETLLEPLLKTPAELAQLRDDLHRIQLYAGTLVSADEKSTVLLIGVRHHLELAVGEALPTLGTLKTACLAAKNIQKIHGFFLPGMVCGKPAKLIAGTRG